MKKFTSIIVILAMLATMTVSLIPSASAAWDGSSSSVSLVGTGSEVDPFLISSENDLAYVAKQVNDDTAPNSFAGMYLKLTANLDLGNLAWTPIGAIKNRCFSGTFDGDGYTISGLNVKTGDDGSSTIFGGVFGHVKDGVIKNLTVENAEVVSLKYGGAIAGQLNVTADTGYTAIINCHVRNAKVRGLQIGGIVGRSSQSKATLGQLEIIGCTVDNVTFAPITESDFPSFSADNHFVGGIVGGAGATVISGCGVTNMTATVFAAKFGPCGGILGVQGADSVIAEVNNCYAIGIDLTALEGSHVTKTELGGLIGKMGHVTDPESRLFNSYVSDVKITNNCSTTAVGVVTGMIGNVLVIQFNDVYYVPVEGLNPVGDDQNYVEPPFATITALADLDLAKLNKGNSTTVWVNDVVKGYPVIDANAIVTNEPEFVDYYIENPIVDTTEETTEGATSSGDETTAETTEEITTAGGSDETTKAPDADVTTEKKDDGSGCGSMIAGAAIIIALAGAAVVLKKRD